MIFFSPSLIITAIGLTIAYFWAGLDGLTVAFLLALLQVALSFDNAVVDATILRNMSLKWQKRFLTWGMLFAVFGVRMLLPLGIVSFTSGLSVGEVAKMAAHQPELYAQHIGAAQHQISAFGGMYLLMLFFSFFFQGSQSIHWIAWLERRLIRLGQIASIEVAFALVTLITLQSFLRPEQKQPVVVAGLVGVVLFLFIKSISEVLDSEHPQDRTRRGLDAFIFLEVLDMSFSLDSVIGAFAMSQDIVIILIGLTIGAMVVRQMTLFMVKKSTLDYFLFLEHGAHYAIGALAMLMLFTLFQKIPDLMIGGIGLGIILLSLWASVRHQRNVVE